MRHLLPLLVLAACGPDVPSEPTWFADVQPILRPNAGRGHGGDTADERISGYRLDRHVAGDMVAIDAADYAASIIQHAVDHEPPAMPPDYELTERQQEILVRWAARDPSVRKGTRANHPGRIELASDAPSEVDQELVLSYRAWDDELDGLVVQLFAYDYDTGVEWPLGKPTGAGLRSLAADTGTLPSKHSFAMRAIVDDGYFDVPASNRENVITLIDSFFVDHGLRGTAPTVVIESPNGGESLLQEATITWTATDPDVDAGGNPDVLRIDLDLVPYTGGVPGQPIAIAAAVPNTGSYVWAIPGSIPTRDAQNTAIPYRIRITATDTLGMPPNLRSDESDLPFTIQASVTTNLVWSDVEALFNNYCATSRCHDRDGVPKRPQFCAAQYRQGSNLTLCDATDEGVYEPRSLVLGRLDTNTMPPGGNPQPTAAERAMMIEWLAGGAKEGMSTGNPPPMFDWSAPAATQNAGTTVDLAWTASDDTGITMGRIEYKRVTGLVSTGCGNAGNTGWTVVNDPMATFTGTGTTWSGSFTWTLPSATNGYYCFRGTVNDANNPPVVDLNPFGVARP